MRKSLIALCMALVLLFATGCGSADVDYVAKELGIVEEVNAILYSGSCWMACANDEAFVLYINGDNSAMVTVSALDNGDVNVTDLSGTWNLDETSFSIFSDSKDAKGKFEWDITQEAEITSIDLKGEGIDATFYLTQVKSYDAAVALAKSYIAHKPKNAGQASIVAIEDISEVLSDYKGVSIVEAFIGSGMEPSYKNRKIFAEKAGIEDYIGTAEQNLYLLEYMGGSLK